MYSLSYLWWNFLWRKQIIIASYAEDETDKKYILNQSIGYWGFCPTKDISDKVYCMQGCREYREYCSSHLLNGWTHAEHEIIRHMVMRPMRSRRLPRNTLIRDCMNIETPERSFADLVLYPWVATVLWMYLVCNHRYSFQRFVSFRLSPYLKAWSS